MTTAYIKQESCTIINEWDKVIFICPVHKSTDGTTKGMFTPEDIESIENLGDKDIKFYFADDTTRDFVPSIPEIVTLIASLAPSIIKMLSGIKGRKQEKLDTITKILEGTHTDAEKILLIEQIVQL